MKALCKVGIDIGGTFTDFVFERADGTSFVRKRPSTVDDYSRAIIEGLAEAVGDVSLEEVRHATTIASNAILELKGAVTGLITTRGFRDILEIRTLRMPKLYDMEWSKPVALVDRARRVEVDERINARGEVETALSRQSAEAAIRKLLAQDVEAIAICLLHSYVNSRHEIMLKEICAELAPHIPVSVSCEVLPQIKEYERTSTTVINSYIRPAVRDYLGRLIEGFARIAVEAPVSLMQSNGGLTSVRSASDLPVNIVESGPAAGVMGVAALLKRMGIPDAISFDMGGTTAKAALIEDGEPSRASEYTVGGGMMIGSRLLSGAGYLLKVPSIDLAEVGTGGGSIVFVDAGGAMKVGPESAGAAPGPACYGNGGTRPTVTDANVVLGYINPHHLVGGEVKLHAALATEVLERDVAKPLGLPLEQAAYGAHMIAASNMIRAIRAVTSERGADPRRHALIAFGGNGAIFAAHMARELKISTVIVPPKAGVFSAWGLLASQPQTYLTRTRRGDLRGLDPSAIAAEFEAMKAEAAAQMTMDGIAAAQLRFERSVGVRYLGQSFELSVPVKEDRFDDGFAARLAADFGALHERTYGHRAAQDEPLELTSLHIRASLPPKNGGLAVAADISAPAGGPVASRRAYFGANEGWRETPVYRRADIGTGVAGPCIVDEIDTTCVVPPDASVRLDGYGNLVMTVER